MYFNFNSEDRNKSAKLKATSKVLTLIGILITVMNLFEKFQSPLAMV